MEGKVVLTYKDGVVEVNSDIQGQELYNVLVGFTTFIASMMVDEKGIIGMSANAAQDALTILGERRGLAS